MMPNLINRVQDLWRSLFTANADSVPATTTGWRGKGREWLRRYLPLEILATITALAGGLLTAAVTSNPIAIAYGGAWSENIGYYSLAFAREMRATADDADLSTWHRAYGAIRRIVWEFGLAEGIDSFVSRPFLMFAATALLGSLEIGIIVGKLAADVIFYAIAIVFYEIGKHKR